MKQHRLHGMRLLLALIALSPSVACAQSPGPCAFTLGYGSIKGESSVQSQKMVPYWFTVSGRAEVSIKGTSLVAKLYDATADGDHTHTLTARLGSGSNGRMPFKTNVNGTLKNLLSDAGDDLLSGLLEVTFGGAGKPVLHSLVVHSAYTFVALSCYGKRAA